MLLDRKFCQSLATNDKSINKASQDELVSLYLTQFQKGLLEKSLQTEDRKVYRQRIQIILLADQGISQTSICQILNCATDTARYWIIITKMGLTHFCSEISFGRPKKINDEYLVRLQQLISHSPKDYGYSFNRWSGQSLSKHLTKEFEIEISSRHLNRLLKDMGLSCKKN
jgi:transposase